MSWAYGSRSLIHPKVLLLQNYGAIMHHMDWDDLRFFLAVARTGSLRGAAKELGVNHSTVSRRIGAFENRLGARLFERLPTGYLTTPAGEDMLESAQNIEQDVAAIDRRVAGQDSRLGGLLQVTMPPHLSLKLLLPDLAAFGEAHPEIKLVLNISYGLADLAMREADVAIRVSNNPPQDLVGRRLVRSAKAVYASDDYLTRHDPISDPESLTWIGWGDTVRYPRWVKESNFPQAPVNHRVNDAIGQVEAAKAGMGISMMPCHLGDLEPTLRRLPPGEAMPGYDLWILTHEDLRRTARVRTFLDFMSAAILAHRDLLEGRCPRA